MSPQLDSTFSVQRTLSTEDGQVNLWYGSFVSETEQLEKQYALLGKTSDELFPIRFRGVVPSRGVPLEGEVPGFLYLTDWQFGEPQRHRPHELRRALPGPALGNDAWGDSGITWRSSIAPV